MVGIVLFGGTGSIGTQTLSIVRNHPNDFKLIAFTYHKNIQKAREIIDEFHPLIVGYSFADDLEKIKNKNILINNQEIEKIIKKSCENFNGPLLFINALTGAAGLKPTYEILKSKHDCLLANKESLILAGEIIMKTAKQNQVDIIPIDSEHSGLYRLINNNKDDIDHLIITASGGALRDLSLEELKTVKPDFALNHPNWDMGKVITINCATMVNKAYEVLEASYLFNYPLEKIDVLLHKESIIHALVEFQDGALAANLGIPSMEIPIAYAIKEGMNNLGIKTSLIDNKLPKLNLKTLKQMHFDEIDHHRYPCFNYLIDNFKKGKYYPVVINAANEESVNRYLNKEISFPEIYQTIVQAVDHYDDYWTTKEPMTIDNIIKLDKEVRDYLLGKKGRD